MLDLLLPRIASIIIIIILFIILFMIIIILFMIIISGIVQINPQISHSAIFVNFHQIDSVAFIWALSLNQIKDKESWAFDWSFTWHQIRHFRNLSFYLSNSQWMVEIRYNLKGMTTLLTKLISGQRILVLPIHPIRPLTQASPQRKASFKEYRPLYTLGLAVHMMRTQVHNDPMTSKLNKTNSKKTQLCFGTFCKIINN